MRNERAAEKRGYRRYAVYRRLNTDVEARQRGRLKAGREGKFLPWGISSARARARDDFLITAVGKEESWFNWR